MKRIILALVVVALASSAVASAQTYTTCAPSCTGPLSPIPSVRFIGTTITGKVYIKRPGSKTYVILAEGQPIPMGSILDTREGSFVLIAAPDASGKTDSVKLWGGVFKATQLLAKPLGGNGSALITQFDLQGSQPPACGRSFRAKKKKNPRLWGDGKGKFRTKGNQSAATVRGTQWYVEEKCNGTYTRVKRGVVEVRDNVRNKTVIVRAGKSYTAPRSKKGS